MINRERIIEALVGCKVGPLAREAASPLVEAWLDKLDTFPDSSWQTIGAEISWYYPLEPKTIIVGQCDRLMVDPDGNMVLGEWKTRKAQEITKAGKAYKGQSEQDWLEEINGGPQLAVYAMAMRGGLFRFGQDWKRLDVHEPRVMVRCVTKNNPPQIWPTRIQDGIFKFKSAMLDATRNALLVKAVQIRAARLLKLVPQQLRGYQCRTYGRLCGYWDMCTENQHPPAGNIAWHPTDPGFEVPKLLGLDPTDPELVVLSQSSYVLSNTCMEKYRIQYGGHGVQEESFELETGTAFHAAMAALYEGMIK